MKKRKQLAYALVLGGLLGLSATAYAQGVPLQPGDGNVKTSDGSVLRSGTGLCVRTGYWEPGSSAPGCDGAPTPPPPPEPTPTPTPPPPPAPPPPTPIPPPPSSEKVTYSADTFFDFDKSVLKPEGRAELNKLVNLLVGVQLEAVTAVGHTDAIGTVQYNLGLSLRRAKSVKAYLIHKGVDPSRIYIDGKGKSHPIATNKTKAGRAKNRRVEIEIIGTRR